MESELSEFTRSRYPALLRRAYLLTGDRGHAEDLVQESLAKMWMARARVVENPDAYVRRVMTNAFISSTRRRRWGLVGRDVGREPAVPDPSGGFDEQDRVWQAMLTLPPRQRAVLVLRYYEDLSEDEICAVLGVGPGTVRSQTSKARAKLRALLTDTDGAAL